jgi:hypothetical protein
MVKYLDWNAALSGDEDYQATMGSEVFRSFAQRVLAEERQEEQIKKKAESNKVAEVTCVEDLYNLIKESSVPNPIMQNLPYDGRTHQEHIVDWTDLADADLEDKEEKKAALDRFTELVKKANEEEAEKELGLDQNMYYLVSKAKQNKVG